MPPRHTKTLEEVAAAEDSNDEDYEDGAPSRSRTRSKKSQRPDRTLKRPKQSRAYRGSDVDSDNDDIESDDDDLDAASEDDYIETNEKGRPVRRSAKKTITYVESDSEEAGFTDEATDEATDEEIKPQRQSKRNELVVTLKTGKQTFATISPPRVRSLRNRSGSYGVKHPPTSSSSVPQPKRRSSRLSHDPEESVVALTNSGNHVEIVRAGSRDPEGIPARAMKGGKGLKYPSKSTIDEEESSDLKFEEDHEELEIKASQHDLPENDPQTNSLEAEEVPKTVSEIEQAAVEQEAEPDAGNGNEADEVDVVEESDDAASVEDGEDDGPVLRGRTRAALKRKADSPPEESERGGKRLRPRRAGASQRTSRSARRKLPDESSDFEPQNEMEKEDDMSESSGSQDSPRKRSQRNDDYDSSNGGGRLTRLRRRGPSRQSPVASIDEEDELAAEVEDLRKDGKKKRIRRDEIIYEPRETRRGGKRPNYDIMRGFQPFEEDEDAAVPTASQQRTRRGGGGGGWQRSLFNIYGPFGGSGALPPVFGGPQGLGAQGDVESDSSDDETMKRPKPVGGTVGMTPVSALPPGGFNLFPPAQPVNSDPAQATAGTPANLGKLKDKQALADADPLGVDQHVNFDSVGGLQGHIDQLKEMVSLPLLYPEIFLRFKIVPPRGVLFYGPPGTGKTLLARALASSVSSQGKKVTFYMRKGADALSKWVGEAERQLRLLFEEARKNQPSIIFFDEIDGLAPVRSSKQDQIHASIVSTLLALMDGMDGRGQVIIIGATNRPDSIDPALRRPGRFDREFYFPLPNTDARRSILDIHTRGWNPPLEPSIKDELAKLTKGYGGADLRALCTEAALNAVQRRYPQIYKSNEKLIIDPKTIEVTPKDFMISVKKMVPSSQRAAASGASPLPKGLEPLLRKPLSDIQAVLTEVLPQKKPRTALEEAQFEDVADGHSFGREIMQQAFETSRIFRPRLLVQGKAGMGQQYIAAALLNHLEGVHVQAFDLPTLHGDSASSPEATMIRLFSEVKMRVPSVIYLPNVQDWYHTVGSNVVSTFLGLLRSVKPTDPILVLGVLEAEKDQLDEQMRRDLFGYSKKAQFELQSPPNQLRYEFFAPLVQFIEQPPDQFPDPINRKRRPLELLNVAPPESTILPPPVSAAEMKAQKKRDRQILNNLKIRLQPIMDQIRTKYKKFRAGIVDENQIRYLFDEADPGTVTSNLPTDMRNRASFRPFEVGKDKHGEPGLIDQANGKFYYNIDTVTIERRLSNGYYKRPRDFLADVKRLAKDAKTMGEEDRLLKANELLANVEVDIGAIEMETTFCAECDKVYEREVTREKEAVEKARRAVESNREMPPPQLTSNVPHGGASEPSTNTVSTGPVRLGEQMEERRPYLSRPLPITPSRPSSHSTHLTNGVGHDTDRLSSVNGGHEADVEGDTPMRDTKPQQGSKQTSHETQKTHTTSSYGQTSSAQPRPIYSHTAPSQQLQKESGMSQPKSQTHVITPLAPGSQVADYLNEASTTQTSSGNKHHSDSSLVERDQQRQGTQEFGPDLFMFHEHRSAGGSEIPDTQGTRRNPLNMPCEAQRPKSSSTNLTVVTENPMHSQGSAIADGSHPSQHSQLTNGTSRPSPASQPEPQPPPSLAIDVPVASGSLSTQSRRASDLNDLLNAPEKPNLVAIHKTDSDNFQRDITDKTSGMSVEQLEQINSVLMDTVWKTRGQWNRVDVLKEVAKAFAEVLDDMVLAGQDFSESSWGVKKRR